MTFSHLIIKFVLSQLNDLDYQPMLDHFHLEYCSHSSTTHARE